VGEFFPTLQPRAAALKRGLELLPSAPCVLTSAFDRRRAGVLVHWVMQCAADPVYVCVGVRTGHRIEPLIRDSHAFALCLIDRRERLVLRTFGAEQGGETDPFDAFAVATCVTGSPVLERSVAAFDCEVVRHIDLESDHELYVGQVLAARTAGAGGGGRMSRG
jgi:flavin reductase (DIM6/NTAB) family NADH-FMN oxidoreductase RutF